MNSRRRITLRVVALAVVRCLAAVGCAGLAASGSSAHHAYHHAAGSGVHPGAQSRPALGATEPALHEGAGGGGGAARQSGFSVSPAATFRFRPPTPRRPYVYSASASRAYSSGVKSGVGGWIALGRRRPRPRRNITTRYGRPLCRSGKTLPICCWPKPTLKLAQDNLSQLSARAADQPTIVTMRVTLASWITSGSICNWRSSSRMNRMRR